MYTAPPRAATHSPSSGKYTMAAEPPTASWALATKFWVTVLVMEGASGFVSAHLVHGAGHERPKLCLVRCCGTRKRLQVR